MTQITRRAHAKINAFLRVRGLREDGYHEIESLVLPVSMHDVIVAGTGKELSVSIVGDRSGDLKEAGGENLALAAARALADAAGLVRPGAEIRIDKRIPVAAGLGGGSADAAATLRALNELWVCGFDDLALATIGARVGSDVPAQLAEGAVFVRGRGDLVDPVHMTPTTWVLAPLPFPVRTPDAFAWWDQGGTTGPDPGALIAAAETGNHDLLGGALFNDLQEPVASRHPQVTAAVASFLRGGALGAVMSGSGPTVAALARDQDHAEKLSAMVPGSMVVSAPPRSEPDAG